ncbi:MAG TPA: TerC family protein [Dissulfurispiraceae bacterium]|nr:TerC family protein [Dissulfurispiraceae bacterium]
MEWLTDSEIWVALITLTTLEIILGIDNIVVISILSGKLPQAQQAKARSIGISLALITRVLLLISIAWLASLTIPLFSAFGRDISVRDLILLAGGLFLLFKGTHEIHGAFERHDEVVRKTARVSFAAIIVQIVVMDVVFSLDSVITAIGMARQLGVMIAAVVIALVLMLLASGTISTFIHRHPSLKMLALSFLLMVGVALVAEGLKFHIPKGYIYFSMGFSGLVETLNILAGTRRAVRKTATPQESQV